jgi:hypothetical protein
VNLRCNKKGTDAMPLKPVPFVQFNAKLTHVRSVEIYGGDSAPQVAAHQYGNENPSLKLCAEVLKKLKDELFGQSNEFILLNIVGRSIEEDPSFVLTATALVEADMTGESAAPAVKKNVKKKASPKKKAKRVKGNG